VVDGDALEMRFGETQRGSNPPLSVTAVFPPFAVDFRVLDLGLFLQ
jgi:hypothetical protein